MAKVSCRKAICARILELARQLGGEGAVERSRGLPDFLGRFRTRHAFLLGLRTGAGLEAVTPRP